MMTALGHPCPDTPAAVEETGATVGTLQCDNGVEECFDVQTLPGVRCPTLGSFGDQDDVWLLPEQQGRDA